MRFVCTVIPGTRLILVGDVDQLPSANGKRIERYHCIASVSCCDTDSYFFRQAGESDIVVNAHKINAEPVIPDNKSRDFSSYEDRMQIRS